MHKKFQINRTKIMGGCQLETKAAHQHSCIDLTLVFENIGPNNQKNANVICEWSLRKLMICHIFITLSYKSNVIFFSGRSNDHFLHARACYMMKQNSPNCLLCPNESFPSKSFYLIHMQEKHRIEVDAMLCISCGISTSIFEYIPRHQIKCFQVGT